MHEASEEKTRRRRATFECVGLKGGGGKVQSSHVFENEAARRGDMRINTILKWSTLLLVAWFYAGEAQAQQQTPVASPQKKSPVYKEGESEYNALQVIVEYQGDLKGFECFVATDPDVYNTDYASFMNLTPSWTACDASWRPHEEIPGAVAKLALVSTRNLPVKHGMNFVYFRANTSAGPGPGGTWSAPVVTNWFVDGRADAPKALNVVGGEVQAIPGPDGRCHPLVIPLLMETEGAKLGYSANGSESSLNNIPSPGGPSWTWTYMFQHDAVLMPTLNAGDQLQLTLWTSLDRYEFSQNPNSVTPWTVRCPATAPAWPLTIDAPQPDALLASLTQISGTAAAGSKIRFTLTPTAPTGVPMLSIDCGEANAAGDWTCNVPALNEGKWQARVLAESGGESRMATVDFELVDLSVTVETPKAIIYPGAYFDANPMKGTASARVEDIEVELCLVGGACTLINNCTLAAGRFSCDLEDLNQDAYLSYTLTVTGIGPNNLRSAPVVVDFDVDGVLPEVDTLVASDGGRQLDFTSSKPNSTFECNVESKALGFVPCSSPYLLPDLPMGAHEVLVRATDTLGQTGPSKPLQWTITRLADLTIVVDRPEEGETYAGTFRLVTGRTSPDIVRVEVEFCEQGQSGCGEIID